MCFVKTRPVWGKYCATHILRNSYITAGCVHLLTVGQRSVGWPGDAQGLKTLICLVDYPFLPYEFKLSCIMTVYRLGGVFWPSHVLQADADHLSHRRSLGKAGHQINIKEAWCLSGLLLLQHNKIHQARVGYQSNNHYNLCLLCHWNLTLHDRTTLLWRSHL